MAGTVRTALFEAILFPGPSRLARAVSMLRPCLFLGDMDFYRAPPLF